MKILSVFVAFLKNTNIYKHLSLLYFWPTPLIWHFLPYKHCQEILHFWSTYPPLLVNVVCRHPLNIERLDRRAEGEIACYGDKAEITECSKNSEMYCFSCCETIELATQYSHREIRLHFFPTLKTFLGSPLSPTSVVLTDRKRTVHFWVGLHFYCIADFVASWLRWLQMFSNDPKWFHLTY